jgi:excinuclease UvrABC nuclease subunit
MNPSNIDLSALPSLFLASRSDLPTCPAVYFVLESDRVLYIGRSGNLQQRWVNHHRYKQLKTISNVRIAWLECSDPSLLPEIEVALIRQFLPPLNDSAVTSPQITLFLDKRLKEKFKRVCSIKGTTMTEEITRFIEESVNENNDLLNLVNKKLEGKA